MKDLLMIGPNGGHNIRPFLDYFQKYDTPFKLTYLSLKKFRHNPHEFSKIKIQNFTVDLGSWITLVRLLRKGHFDFIWYHGAYQLPIALTIYLFKRSDTKINLNIWSEALPRAARKKNLRGKIYRYFLKKSDVVQCNWYGTEKLVKLAEPKSKTVVRLWGLAESYFEHNENPTLTQETINFVSSIPKEKYIFFFPKALTPANRHDLIIEATNELVKQNVTNFKVYFWLGKIDEAIYLDLADLINTYSLKEYIELKEHSFLPFHDMKYIWSFVDCALQVVDKDQFSTSVVEPLYLKKNLLISKITPYELVEEKFKITLDFVQNRKEDISTMMENFMKGYSTSESELEKRKRSVEEHLNFSINLKETLSFYNDWLDVCNS